MYQTKPYQWSSLLTYGCIAALVAACGSKNNSNNAPSAPPATVVVQSTPVSNPLGTTPIQTPAPTAFTTVILNKSDVVSPYTQSSLVLNLGVQGGVPATTDQISFQCLRETDTSFHPCNGQPADTYSFGTLTDGQQVSLQVQAVNNATGAVATPDSVSFTVALGGLIVNGATTPSGSLATATTGVFQLTWGGSAQTPGDHVQCQLDQAPASDCTQGYTVNLGQIASSDGPGSHTLLIQALGASGSVVGSSTLNFCAGQCSSGSINNPGGPVTTTPPGPVQTGPQIFQLGSFYQFTVPQGMHVTEYATTKTDNSQFMFYRISAASDPTYIGNYGCTSTWDTTVTSPSPAGQPLNYCLSTPPNTLINKIISGSGIADNHIEVSTDVQSITDQNQNIIDFNVFDKTYQYMHGRSRFEQLCANRSGSIFRSPPIEVQQSFWGNPVRAVLYMCTADLVVPTGPGLPTRNPVLWQNSWWIGAFFIESSTQGLPQPECFDQNFVDFNGTHPANYVPNTAACATYSNPSLLEMTFVSKTTYPAPQYFAQDIQQLMIQTLQQITPMGSATPY